MLSILVCSTLLVNAQQQDSTLPKAVQYFLEIEKICKTEAGKTWGQDLGSPVLLVDRSTRKVYANQPDKENLLQANGTIFTGQLPLEVNIANTATSWAGIEWTMLVLPLPASYHNRITLMVHELFHHIQDNLGLPASSPSLDHLEKMEGRILFRLELEALVSALYKPVHQRKQDIIQALQIRQLRYRVFSNAEQSECRLEMNEGLAEFTGVLVSNIHESDSSYLKTTVKDAIKMYPSFTRSAAYITGPLYGILLSQRAPGWQHRIGQHSCFPALIKKAYALPDQIPALKSIRDCLILYPDAGAIVKEENNREEEHLQKEKEYLSGLVQGNVLEIPLTGAMKFSFNPNNLFSLGEYGVVYPGLTMTDAWGRLEVAGEALIRDWRKLYLSISKLTGKEGSHLQGTGWSLELSDGWKVVPGNRPGDLLLIQQQP